MSEMNFDEVKEKALTYLEYRAHTEKELSDKLLRAGAKTEDIEAVTEFCRRYGFVNDSAYAMAKARDLKNLKKYGKRRIKAELYNKGISSQLIEEALEQLEDDETDALLPLVEKRLKGNFDKKNIDKCIRYFAYRGYSFSDIRECVDRLKADYE